MNIHKKIISFTTSAVVFSLILVYFLLSYRFSNAFTFSVPKICVTTGDFIAAGESFTTYVCVAGESEV